MGSGTQGTGNQTSQNGYPKQQNKAVVSNMNTGQGVAHQGLGQVQGISAPAGVGPNSQGLNQPAPSYPILNPAVYGQQTQGGAQGGTSSGQPPQNASFPSSGATPSQNLPTQGGGVANLGNMGSQYGENVMSGQFLNPNSNPFERGAMNSADQATIQNYMTAIAPMTNSEFAMAGNFGGSSMMDAQANNEYQLGNALGNINTNIANNTYNQGIQQMEQTAGQLGGLQQNQYAAAQQPLNYQNQANAGLMSLMGGYGYNQQKNTLPGDQFTAAQGVGAGLGLAGLGIY